MKNHILIAALCALPLTARSQTTNLVASFSTKFEWSKSQTVGVAGYQFAVTGANENAVTGPPPLRAVMLANNFVVLSNVVPASFPNGSYLAWARAYAPVPGSTNIVWSEWAGPAAFPFASWVKPMPPGAPGMVRDTALEVIVNISVP